MKASDAFCEQPMQMDDYGMDRRHYGRHGDCTISPTYDDDTHHCGEDVNEEDNELKSN